MIDKNQAKILEHYPDAVAEEECCDCFCIWAGPNGLISTRDCMIIPYRSLLGLGHTEQEAWENAVIHIKLLKGKP